MSVTYLTTPIVEVRHDPPPRGSGMTREGYTKRSGAPTSRMIRLQGEKRWRRLMVWQFSNLGTLFVKIDGKPHVVREEDLPAAGDTATGRVEIGPSKKTSHARIMKTTKSPSRRGFLASKIAVGALVARVEAPTEIYRVTEKFPAYLRVLPYQRSGGEKLLFPMKPISARMLTDGSSRWIVVGKS